MSALTFATAQILRLLPRAGVSRAAGWLADHTWSAPLGRAVVGVYSKMYDVTLDDCAQHDGWRAASYARLSAPAVRSGKKCPATCGVPELRVALTMSSN